MKNRKNRVPNEENIRSDQSRENRNIDNSNKVSTRLATELDSSTENISRKRKTNRRSNRSMDA